MFILIKCAGRSITVAQNPTVKECTVADAVVQVDSEGSISVIKNRGRELGHVQICGHPFSSIVGSDEGTHYCRECELESRCFCLLEYVYGQTMGDKLKSSIEDDEMMAIYLSVGKIREIAQIMEKK